MNMSATMEKMKEMRLHGMVSSLKNIMNNGLSNNLTVYEILTHLIETEYLERSNKTRYYYRSYRCWEKLHRMRSRASGLCIGI